jgi:hypothetical protein
MFFRKSKTVVKTNAVKTPREQAWLEFAKTLDLKEAQGSVGMMRMLLNEPIASISALYKTEVLAVDHSKLQMFFLDYQQANKHVSQLVSVCLLSVPQKSFISLKATRKPHKVMEKLGASASGGVVVPFEDVVFSEAVTIYARDIEATQNILQPKARDILHRALYERGIAPTFLMGEKVLLFSHAAAIETATPLDSLEGLAADLLSLYGVLRAMSNE